MPSVGVRVDEEVAGRPDVRGHGGYVFRWGEGWFEEIRDGGLGWKFERDDTSAIDIRVNLLLDIFRRSHSFALPALSDVVNYVEAAISNFQGEGPRSLETMELKISKRDGRTHFFLSVKKTRNQGVSSSRYVLH